MNLKQACDELGIALGLDPSPLYDYTQEDRIGGFNLDPNQRRWPMGSMWEVEGLLLYALVRTLKPRQVAEVGTWVGCSATHILEAMAVNGKGKLTSIDINPAAGQDIPLSLRKRWTFVQGRGEDCLAALTDIDILFEDGPHDMEGTAAILATGRDHLNPRITLSHDGAHFLVGADIREAYRRVYRVEPRVLLIDPSDCGFCYVVHHD
jgi:hypothetical protein